VKCILEVEKDLWSEGSRTWRLGVECRRNNDEELLGFINVG
jgi:hypothetical protein